MGISLLAFVFTLFVSLSNCQVFYQGCSSLDYYQCTVCFDNNYSTFTGCYQKYCSRYYYYYSNGKRKSTCVQYSYYTYSQQACIAACCGDVGIGVTTLTQNFLAVCIQQNKRLTNLIGIIIGSVFGGIVLIAVSIFFFIWRKNHA